MTTQFWKAWQQLKHLQGTSAFPVLFTSAQALWQLLVEFALHLPPVLAAEELAVVPGKAVSSQPLQSAQDLTHGPRTLSGATQTSKNWGSVGRSCCTPCPCPARSLSLPPRPWAPACFAEREQVNLHTTSKISGSCPCSCPPAAWVSTIRLPSGTATLFSIIRLGRGRPPLLHPDHQGAPARHTWCSCRRQPLSTKLLGQEEAHLLSTLSYRRLLCCLITLSS